MHSSYVQPFAESIQNVFETMLQLPIQTGEPSIKRCGDPRFDVSGIIGMSGGAIGSVVLSFPIATAERIVSLFTDDSLEHAHEHFADAIGELLSIICGGAKAQFGDKNVSIGLPSVIVGDTHSVHSAEDVVCLSLPCRCDCGNFVLEVSIGSRCAGQAAASQVTADRRLIPIT